MGAAQAPPSALHPTTHAMLGAGCLEGDAALKHEGRDGILCFCVPQLMCVRGDGGLH